MLSGMSSLDYWVVIVFSIGILVAGLALSDKRANMTSFFAAGGAVPWWMSGLSLYMSFFSAGTFVVWGSIAYEHGWVAVMIQWTMAIGGDRKSTRLNSSHYCTPRIQSSALKKKQHKRTTNTHTRH